MALSAPLLTKKRIIKVSLESIKGTKVAGTSAVYTEDLAINPAIEVAQRPGGGAQLGHSEKAVAGVRKGTCNFVLDLRGNGSAGLDSGQAILLQACGLAQTSEVYQVHSSYSDQKCISIDCWEDGKKKGLSGAMGNATFEFEAGGVVRVRFEFEGVWIAPTDEAVPAFAPGTQTPFRFAGGSFTLGGESIKISRAAIATGNVIAMRPDPSNAAGIICAAITDYDNTFEGDPEADLVAGYDFNGVFLAGTEAAVVLAVSDGTDTGTFTMPKVQTRELTESDREGIQTYDFTGQCNHDSGNDSLKLAIT